MYQWVDILQIAFIQQITHPNPILRRAKALFCTGSDLKNIRNRIKVHTGPVLFFSYFYPDK